MLLIIEIYLTIKAYRNGWGTKALMPLGLIIALGVIIALVGDNQGWGTQQIQSSLLNLIPLELLMDGVVAWMAWRKPRPIPAADTTETAPAEPQPEESMTSTC